MTAESVRKPDSQSNNTTKLERLSAPYVSQCQKYVIRSRTFERQYATFYASRLRVSSDPLKKQVRSKWGPDSIIKPLCDVIGDETTVVIGTLYKHMDLHPSILKEISEEHNIIPQPVSEEYAADDDYLILEDDLQRVVLCGNIDPQNHVTGVNIAVKGYTEENGKFFVEDFCYASVFSPPKLPVIPSDKYILLISGISFGDPNVLYPFKLLVDLVTGQLGEESDHNKFSRLVRIIVAGNSIGQHTYDFTKAKILTRKSKAETVENVKLLDDLFSEMIESVDIDVMPGEFDPSNHLLPQQPLHPCMFPKCSSYSTFHVVTNPYEASINGVRFLGSSGQNVKDISRYSKLTDPIEIMEKMLNWGHMLPTAPDTLNCYPYLDEDPFVLSEYPHVFFSGNCSKFGYKKYCNKQVALVAVPKFQQTFSAVLLNLRNLEVETISFQDSVL